AASFVGREEERAVFLDWTTECPAKLILMECGFGDVEISLRIQAIVAEKLVDVPVKGVSSRLGNYVDDSTGIPPILGVERVGENAEFLNGVRSRLHGGQVGELIVCIATVHTEVVGSSPASVHRDHTRTVTAVKQVRTRRRLDARLQREQLVGIAGIQR